MSNSYFFSHGLFILPALKNNEDLGFKDIIVSKKKLLKRVENLCLYFKENMPKYRNSLKKVGSSSYGLDYSTGMTKLDDKRPVTACLVEKDDDGNIKYPM